MKFIKRQDDKKRYKLQNPEKYLGDPDNIVIRSSWEYRAFQFCDNNINVIKWASEEIAIPYMKPLINGSMKPALYYPDLYVEYFDKDDNFVKEVVEVKPLKQTMASKARTRENKLYENMVYVVNMAKWHAAREWCTRNGMVFSIATENSIFKNKLAGK